MSAKQQVIEKIKSLFPHLLIQELPYRKEKPHLIVTNPSNKKSLRIRVHSSVNYLDKPGVVKDAFVAHLQYSGWWTFSPAELFNTPADLWILIWPGSQHPTKSLLMPFPDLTFAMHQFCTERLDGQKDFYWYYPKNGTSFAARPLSNDEIVTALEHPENINPELALTKYVDAWQRFIGDILQ